MDPLYRLNFKAWYQSDSRVRRLELPSGRIEYQYDDAARSTTVTDRNDLISRYYQDPEGITVRVVNPLGEETRIVLDAGRNPIELWEGGALRQKMEYDSEHRIISRRSFAPTAELTAHYEYDAATGNLARISYNDGRVQSFEYDATGNLMAWSGNSGARSYQWSSSGDLTKLSRAETGETLELAYGADGEVSQVVEAGEMTTTFGYEGRMQPSEITFPQGDAARLAYDSVGFRRALEYENGGKAEYSFDPAGNLVASNVTKADGSRNGQRLELDDSYQLIRRVFEDGTESRYKYDKNGNLIEAADGETITRFEYDALNRLTAIVTDEGERLEYQYAPGEPSLIAQSDVETGWLSGERRDSGQTFSRQRELFATRTYAVPLGAVRFSEAVGRFQLSGETGDEILTPDVAVEAPLRKLRLWGEGHHDRHNFLAASNLLFQPPEYATVNCCPLCVRGEICEPCDPEPPPQLSSVIITGPGGGPPPSHVALRAPGSTAPNEIELEAQGTPEGGSYRWTNLDSDKVDMTVLSSPTDTPNRVRIVSKAQSASQFDVQIRVDYEEVPNAFPAFAAKDITVHKPTSLMIVSDTGSLQDVDCVALFGGPDYCGIRRDILYKALNQFGEGIPIAGLPAEESFSAGSNTCGGVPGTPTPQGGQTLSDGSFNGPDRFAMCSSSCLPAAANCHPTGSCSLSFQQAWKVSGFTVRNNSVTITCTQVTVTQQ